MKQYRGFDIDGIFFTCEADIDKHIKRKWISDYKIRIELFNRYITHNRHDLAMRMCDEADKIAMRLVKECGMTWNEIEALDMTIA